MTVEDAIARLFTAGALQPAWFTPTMLAAAPVERTRSIIDGIVAELGPYQSIAPNRSRFTVTFARGTIQAGFIVEPAKTDAMRAGLIRDFADTYIALAPEVATTVWFTSKNWLQKNPDVAKNLVKAIYATGRWANTHGPEAAAIIARVTKIDPAVVAAQQRRLFATSNDRKYVEATLTLAARYGMLARPVTYEEFCAS